MDIEGGELLAMKGAKRLLDGDFGDLPVIAFEYSTLFPMRGGEGACSYCSCFWTAAGVSGCFHPVKGAAAN